MYKSIEQFRTDKEAARVRVERAENALTRRWGVLQSSNTRGIIIRDAFGDVLNSWKPYRVVNDLLKGKVNSSAVEMATSLYASARPTFLKRILVRGAGNLLSKLFRSSKERKGTTVDIASEA